MEKIPNFFLIGAPKCGTSAMRDYLSQHPEVFFSTPDEPGFFDAECRYVSPNQCAYKSLDDYLALYRKANRSHKVIAEGSVFILYSRNAIKRILDFNSEAKFLVMLRNPVDAFISMHGENLKSLLVGREPHDNIHDAWNDLKNRSNVNEISKVHPLAFQYDKLFSYSEHVKQLLALVDRKNIKFAIYDNFVESNISVYKNICEFLGIDNQFVPEIKKLNERSQAKDNVFAKLVGCAALFARNVRFLKLLRGKGYTLNRFTQKQLAKPVFSAEFKEQVVGFYKKDVVELENLLSIDLSKWYALHEQYGR